MTVKVEVTITNGKGTPKTFQLTETASPVKNKAGKLSLAHFQPAPDCQVIKSFSKLYIDTTELNS